MILVFDTETTGLPVRGAAVDDPAQPHLVQLAALLLDDNLTEMASLSLIVNPGFPIPLEASRIHGITDEVAQRAGVPQRTALLLYAELHMRADIVVAHNIRFDMQVMRTAAARTEICLGSGVVPYCTMNASAALVGLPPTERMLAAGYNRPKPPSLSECIRHFFDEDLVGAHDALVDVRACARIYRRLQETVA